MTILFYLIAFLPLACLMGVSHTLVPICEEYNEELKQSCLSDAFYLPIYGLIISIIIINIFLYQDNRKTKSQSFVREIKNE